MKTKKTKIIIVVAVLMVLILSALYLRPIKTVNRRFDVNYISPERFEEILVEDLNASLVDEPSFSHRSCNEYGIKEDTIGTVDYTLYTYMNSVWGRQSCSYYLFDETKYALMYFESRAGKYENALGENEYYCDDDEGYCLVNASDMLQQEYEAFYFKDNMVIRVYQHSYSGLPYARTGSFSAINRICSEIGVLTPEGIAGDDGVRKLFQMADGVIPHDPKDANVDAIKKMRESDKYLDSDLETKREMIYELLRKMSVEGAGFYTDPVISMDDVIMEEDWFSVIIREDDDSETFTWQY